MFTLYFDTLDNTDKEIIGQKLHEALKGSRAYINNDIILNIDKDCTIELTIGDENDHNYETTIDCVCWDMGPLYKEYYKKHSDMKVEVKEE